MPKARRTSYNLAFKLKIVAEAEAVENNSEIAREYGISESMVRRWRKDQENLFNGEIKLSAKRKTMGCFTPKYPAMDQRLLEWFSEQRSQGENHVTSLFTHPWEQNILIGQFLIVVKTLVSLLICSMFPSF